VAGVVVGDLDIIPSWPAHGWLFAVAITSQVVGYGLVNLSLPHLPAVVTSVLLLLQPALTVLFSAILLGEAPSALQLTGVALVMAGVVVAASGGRPGRGDASRADLGPASAIAMGEPAGI
ncbi:MAG TPA: DMT family transporter, partial [Candidatus Saccharimonadales bacterium]|nr:DMT family transporter [Candidatus Saccharimonadales bacterium]